MKHPRRQKASPRSLPRDTGFLSARWLALQAVRGFAQRGAFISRVLDDYFETAALDPREKRLATELASEVVRRRLTLNTVLSAFSSRPRESIDNAIWIVLQLGACQLLCLPRIPAHAAIHETVELCEQLRMPQAKGFVNGVLRNLSRGIRETTVREMPPTSGETHTTLDLSSLDRRSLPLAGWDDGRLQLRVVRFDRPVLSETEGDWLSQIASLPEWLLERWRNQEAATGESSPATSNLLSPNLLNWGIYFTTLGRWGLRVNPLRATRDSVLAALHEADVAAEPGSLPEAIRLRGSLAVGDVSGFRQGWFSVQDESAMFAVDLLSPQPGETILDMCAAPGGKTCHIAERLGGAGLVVARDISRQRLLDVRDNASRLGLANIVLELSSALPDLPTDTEESGNVETVAPAQSVESANMGIISPADDSRHFDAVLVDVPCSNTGVLGKRPEARWRLSGSSFSELVPLQQRLLARGLDQCRPGGRVVYSTCSIDSEENEAVVRAVLSSREDAQLVEERRHRPGEPSDGGYQALIAKR